jgi:hypothetical protein
MQSTAQQISGLARVLPELKRLSGVATGQATRSAQAAASSARTRARRRPPVTRR